MSHACDLQTNDLAKELKSTPNSQEVGKFRQISREMGNLSKRYGAIIEPSLTKPEQGIKSNFDISDLLLNISSNLNDTNLIFQKRT